MTNTLSVRGAEDVSRETRVLLAEYENHVRRWSKRVNLVSPNSLKHFTERHIRDSEQVFRLCPHDAKTWVDMGSGAGLPGMVIAILAAEKKPKLRLSLIEADQRKAAFLTTTSAAIGVEVKVIAERIEAVQPLQADVISARALAALDRLLGLARRHVADGGVCLFPKGRGWQEEVFKARQVWDFEPEAIPSDTQAGAAILRIRAPLRQLHLGEQ